jgi:hypothetical protein
MTNNSELTARDPELPLLVFVLTYFRERCPEPDDREVFEGVYATLAAMERSITARMEQLALTRDSFCVRQVLVEGFTSQGLTTLNDTCSALMLERIGAIQALIEKIRAAPIAEAVYPQLH